MSIHYESVQQIEAIVQGFEQCTTPKDDFSHASHLTVALWYLGHNSFDGAAAKMRNGLFRFIKHHDIPSEKYNETITMFWLDVVARFVAGDIAAIDDKRERLALPANQLVPVANELIQALRDPRLLFDYYSEGLINSPDAKVEWLPPDRKQLG